MDYFLIQLLSDPRQEFAPLVAVLGALIGPSLGFLALFYPAAGGRVETISCPGCALQWRPRDVIRLRAVGRCRRCRHRLVAYPWLLCLVSGVVFGGIYREFGLCLELPLYLYLAGLGVILLVTDVRVRRLPWNLIGPAYLVTLSWLGSLALARALLPGRDLFRPSPYYGMDDLFGIALLCGGAMLLPYLLLFLFRPARVGFGDVTLAGLLGVVLGWQGLTQVFTGMFLGPALAVLLMLGLLLARRVGWRTEVPYGPFLLAGAWLAMVGEDPLAKLLVEIFGWKW